MSRMTRTLMAVGCGFAAGLAIGPISVLMANVSDTLMRGWSWPEVNSKYILLLLASSVPAGVNGAIGASLAAALSSRGRLGITVLPISLHVAAALWALIDDPREFLLFQLVTLMFTVVIWPAGRLGQVIGWALRSRHPQTANAKLEAAPDPAGM